MAYPDDLDNLFDPISTTPLVNTPKAHHDWHDDANTAIEALEAKVGVDGSAVTTTHDYKLSGVTGTDKAVSKTGGETLTNKTLTSPTLNTPTINTPTINTPTIINGFIGARAYLTTSIGNTVSGSYTKIALDGESYDVGGNFASGKFVAPVNGYYAVSAKVDFNACTTAKTYTCAVHKNNAIFILNQIGYVTTSDTLLTVPISDVVYLAATDYLELFYDHNGATTVDILGDVGEYYTYLTVVLLRQVT